VSRIAVGPHAYIVSGNSPWNSLEDVLNAARQNPESFRMTWFGGNTTTDFSLIQLFSEAGMDVSDIQTVPFQGTGPGVQAVASDEVQFGAAGASGAFSLYSSGDLKVLAVTGEERLQEMPDVPTTAELGSESVDMTFWVGISGPPDLPQGITDKLEAAANTVANDPETAEELQAAGLYPEFLGAQETTDYVHQEAEVFESLAAEAGTTDE
jgi:putative tricarboxylic transport membrane protein